jgi:hypothetical protein
MHGPGPFDDPFMFREPNPRSEAPSQRRHALIGLGALTVVMVLVALFLLS